jgi:hypothetical protein
MPGNPQTVEMFWTWGSILTLALTTGLCTAVFNQGFDWIKQTVQRRQEHKRAGKGLALKLVEMLTAYAQECNSRIDYNRYDERTGTYGRHSQMPTLPPYPDGPSELLPSRVAAGLQDLRNEVGEAVRDIKATSEIDGPEDAIDVATHRYAIVGYTGLKLAVRLRRHYRLGPYQAAGRSSFASDLRKHYRASRRGPIRRLWASLLVQRIRRRLRRWRLRITNIYRGMGRKLRT